MRKTQLIGRSLLCVILAAVAGALTWHLHLRYLPYRSVVASAQKEPESSKFTDERISSSAKYCASVNSKNGHGGYGGAQRVISDGMCYAQFEDGEIHAAPQEGPTVASAQCSYDVSVLRTNMQLDTEVDYLKRRKSDLDRPESTRTSESDLRRVATVEVFRSSWGALCK
jgi:hypothetical protein